MQGLTNQRPGCLAGPFTRSMQRCGRQQCTVLHVQGRTCFLGGGRGAHDQVLSFHQPPLAQQLQAAAEALHLAARHAQLEAVQARAAQQLVQSAAAGRRSITAERGGSAAPQRRPAAWGSAQGRTTPRQHAEWPPHGRAWHERSAAAPKPRTANAQREAASHEHQGVVQRHRQLNVPKVARALVGGQAARGAPGKRGGGWAGGLRVWAMHACGGRMGASHQQRSAGLARAAARCGVGLRAAGGSKACANQALSAKSQALSTKRVAVATASTATCNTTRLPAKPSSPLLGVHGGRTPRATSTNEHHNPLQSTRAAWRTAPWGPWAPAPGRTARPAPRSSCCQR